MVKKTQAAAAADVPKSPKIRILGAIPACHSDHVKYREKVLAAVQANIEANPNLDITFTVDEAADNRVDVENTWDPIVDKFNALTERVLKEGFDYLWLVEADVVIPPNALQHLYNSNMDMAAAVVPYKFQNDEYWEQYGFKKGERPVGGKIYVGMACTGFFEPDKDGKPTFATKTLYLKDTQDRLLQGSPEHMIFNGTGCVLISRKIFESGLRWRWDNKVCGFDVYFWQDVQKAGFSAVTDGFVICQHLGK